MDTPPLPTYTVGEKVTIWITGVIGSFEAVVIEGGTPHHPCLRVTSDPSWSQYRLKSGDYGITGRVSE